VGATGIEPVTSAVRTNRPLRTAPHRTCRRTAEPQVSVVVLPWRVMRLEALSGRVADKLLTDHEGVPSSTQARTER